LGDGRSARKNLKKSLEFKKDFSVMMLRLFSYLPKSATWFLYAGMNEAKYVTSNIKVFKAKSKFRDEYGEAKAFMSQMSHG